jgi:hypothetical protein
MHTLQHLRAIGNNPAAVQRSVEKVGGLHVWSCVDSIQAACPRRCERLHVSFMDYPYEQAVVHTSLHWEQT